MATKIEETSTTNETWTLWENRGIKMGLKDKELFSFVNEKVQDETLRQDRINERNYNKELLDKQTVKIQREIELEKLRKLEGECPVAIVDVDSPWIAGKIECLIMKNPVVPLIIGNLSVIKDTDSEAIVKKWIDKKITERQNICCFSINESVTCLNQVTCSHIAFENKEMTNWNGTERICNYIQRWESTLPTGIEEINKISGLRDKLIGNQRAYRIAGQYNTNYNVMKDKLSFHMDHNVKSRSHNLNVITRSMQSNLDNKEFQGPCDDHHN
ncbi:hypothetical protein Btru_068329 [Bulinus truncatus]|nr:hypothetical protein Btru_068329 [Bulinus truncatus]